MLFLLTHMCCFSPWILLSSGHRSLFSYEFSAYSGDPIAAFAPVKYLVREVIDSHGELSHKAELGRWLWLPGCPTHPPAASRCLFAMAMLTAPLPQRTPKALHRRLLQQHKHPRY